MQSCYKHMQTYHANTYVIAMRSHVLLGSWELSGDIFPSNPKAPSPSHSNTLRQTKLVRSHNHIMKI